MAEQGAQVEQAGPVTFGQMRKAVIEAIALVHLASCNLDTELTLTAAERARKVAAYEQLVSDLRGVIKLISAHEQLHDLHNKLRGGSHYV